MPSYRRTLIKGASYFFTLVSFQRQPILCDKPIREALRNAIKLTQKKYPFNIDAWILMPDHLHCIWTLPEKDSDYSVRWNQIKRRVSIECKQYKKQSLMNTSKSKHRESTIWQRRFWEHQIRDDADYKRHFDYIHFNPVKHGLVNSPNQWEYSTFHKAVKDNVYDKNWGAYENPELYGDFGE